MTTQVESFLAEWHRIVAAKDIAALTGVLAEDVELGAPPYWNPLQGRALVQHLLGLILETIEGFTYHREWSQGRELALEFKGRVGDLDVQGIDLISLDDDGRIRRLEVPMRPLNAIEALRRTIAPQVVAFLEKQARDAV
jgi:hypothetical protein